MSSKKTKLFMALVICTRERPKMLACLLDTVAKMDNPDGLPIRVVVVENGPLSSAKEVVEGFADRLDIHYFREKRAGLVYARNTAIERALETGAGWIGFLDDDERVSPKWLGAMVDAIGLYPDTLAFSGPVIRYDPDSVTRWYPRQTAIFGKSGQTIWNVGTGNVLFKRELFSADGHNLRFDMAFNLSGGEDTDLFLRLRRAGIKIRWVPEAACEEDVLPERATFRAKAGRSIRNMHNFGRIYIRLYGAVAGRLAIVYFIVKWSYHALIYAVVGAFVLIFSETRGVRLLARAVHRGCMATGYFLSLFRGLAPHYATVDGH